MASLLNAVLSIAGLLICGSVLVFVLVVAVLIFFLVRQKPMQVSSTPPTPQIQATIVSPTAATGASAPAAPPAPPTPPAAPPAPPATPPATNG